MAAKPREYRRLPGRGIKREGFFSGAFNARRSRLWLGQDHLLCIESQWYTENYRRFYFRDIQAVIIRKTISGKIINLVLGLLALLALLPAFGNTGGWQTFWIIWGGVFSFFLLLNTFAGPTCVCHMRTAVQTEELPSLRRLRRARKVLARVRPLIAEAQGQLSPEEIPVRMAQLAASAETTGTEFPAPPIIVSPAPGSLPPQ